MLLPIRIRIYDRNIPENLLDGEDQGVLYNDHHFYPCNRFRQLDGMVYGATHYKRMVSDNCKKSTREFNTCWRSFCLHVFAWRIKLQNHTEKSAYSPPLFTSDLKDDLRCSIYIHSNSEFMNDKQKKNSPIVSHKCSCFGAKMCRKKMYNIPTKNLQPIYHVTRTCHQG